MTLPEITSVRNPAVAQFTQLRKAPSGDRFLIEGTRFVEELPAKCVTEVWTTDPELHAAFLARLTPETPVRRVSPEVMKKVCSAVSGQTILCVARRVSPPRPDRLVLLDGVQDPGNVGTIIRTAYAFGFGVLLSPGCANPWSAKTLTATAGAFRSCYVEQTDDLVRSMEALKQDGFTVYATAIDKTAVSPQELTVPDRCAIVIGSEGRGITPQARAAADRTVYIPMENPINSLNAASAASILIYSLR